MPQAVNRPGTVMFVAIVLFLFGTLYILSALATGGQAGYIAFFSAPPDPNAKIRPDDVAANLHFLPQEVPGYVAIVIGVAVLDILFGFGQLYCGIGVLKMKPSARMATIALILLRLLYILGFDAFSALVLYPAQIKFYELHPLELPNQGPEVINMATFMRFILYGAMVVKIFVELFVAGLIVILLSTAKTRAAFAGIVEPTEDELPKKSSSQYVGYDDEEGYSPPSTGIQERS